MAAPEDGRTPAWPQPTRHRRQLRNSGLCQQIFGYIPVSICTCLTCFAYATAIPLRSY
jgi:hypothetical protein